MLRYPPTVQGPKVRRLFAGAKGIRTLGPALKASRTVRGDPSRLAARGKGGRSLGSAAKWLTVLHPAEDQFLQALREQHGDAGQSRLLSFFLRRLAGGRLML